METKSFVTFQDGHTEEIVYFETCGANDVLFVTKSGVYLENSYIISEPFHHMLGMRRIEFLKLSPIPKVLGSSRKPEFSYFTMPDIKSITIDKRVPYEYEIDGDGVYIHGKVLAAPDADEKEIRQLILDDLDITIKKKE